MYHYRAEQGSLAVTLELSCDAQEPLLTVLAAFYYHHRNKALLDAPVKVYQDRLPVMEEQVEAELEKIRMFFVERRIVK